MQELRRVQSHARIIRLIYASAIAIPLQLLVSSFTLQAKTVSSQRVISTIKGTCGARLLKRLGAGTLVFASAFSILAAADKSSEFSEGANAYRRGAFDEAAAHWERSVEESRRAGQKADQATQMIALASAYQALGQQTHAVGLLED